MDFLVCGSVSMLVGSKSGVSSVSRGTCFDWLSHQGPPISGTRYTRLCIACFALLGVDRGQNSFTYLQNISLIIPWLSLVIFIILEGLFVFWVMHFICSHIGLLFQLSLELAPHTNIPVLNNILIDCFSAAPHLTCLEEWWASGFNPDTLCTQKYLYFHTFYNSTEHLRSIVLHWACVLHVAGQ